MDLICTTCAMPACHVYQPNVTGRRPLAFVTIEIGIGHTATHEIDQFRRTDACFKRSDKINDGNFDQQNLY